MLDVMKTTMASNAQLFVAMPKKAFVGDDSPGFMIRLAGKDVRLAVELANAQGFEALAGRAAQETLERAARMGRRARHGGPDAPARGRARDHGAPGERLHRADPRRPPPMDAARPSSASTGRTAASACATICCVLSRGGLTGRAARRIGAALAGAVTVSLPYGVGLVGRDRAVYVAALHALATHPNVGATLVVGDNPDLVTEVAEAAAARHTPVRRPEHGRVRSDALTLTERGLREGARLRHRDLGPCRDAAPLSALTIGLECGRSDPSSGLVANPLLGLIADRVAGAGGRAISAKRWNGSGPSTC